MSNVLKKITKKYKWLRFLNYKTTKLAVLSAALFGLCLSSGASFAKYRDENYGGENAGAAKFEYGKITPDFKSIQEPKSSNGLKQGVHAFSREFCLEIPKVEVSIAYTLKLRLVAQNIDDFYATDSGLDHTSFVSDNSSGNFYYFGPKSATNDEIEQKNGTLGTAIGENVTFAVDNWFKGEKTSENGTYSWKPSNVVGDKDIIEFDSGIVNAGESLTVYYNVVVFITSHTVNRQFELENSKILYDYNVEQVVL